jgi:hypothetical protein
MMRDAKVHGHEVVLFKVLVYHLTSVMNEFLEEGAETK